jgi:predicted dehydrogenase
MKSSMLKVAFVGFRHGHILALYKHLLKHPKFQVVGACEEHEPTRRQLAQAGVVRLTHRRYASLLEEADCDIIAVGDYYSIRGRRIIAALRSGRHVVADKPICTRLTELAEIERLARTMRRHISAQLDLFDCGAFRAAREILRGGRIGEIHAIHFTGAHPLLMERRPSWYFEKGKQGGTINDIAIHAVALLPWLTGLKFAAVVGARTWNAFASRHPHFHDAAQFMLRMNNDCGVLGDVSYSLPDSQGYSLPQYWRFTFYGRKGLLEVGYNLPHLFLALNGEPQPRTLPVATAEPFGYLKMLTGVKHGLPFATRDVLAATRTTLRIQQAADTGQSQKL